MPYHCALAIRLIRSLVLVPALTSALCAVSAVPLAAVTFTPGHTYVPQDGGQIADLDEAGKGRPDYCKQR